MHMACCTFEEHHQPLLFSIAALSLPKYITAFTYETVCSLLTDSNDLVLKFDKADTKILGILTVTDMIPKLFPSHSVTNITPNMERYDSALMFAPCDCSF